MNTPRQWSFLSAVQCAVGEIMEYVDLFTVRVYVDDSADRFLNIEDLVERIRIECRDLGLSSVIETSAKTGGVRFMRLTMISKLDMSPMGVVEITHGIEVSSVVFDLSAYSVVIKEDSVMLYFGNYSGKEVILWCKTLEKVPA